MDAPAIPSQANNIVPSDTSVLEALRMREAFQTRFHNIQASHWSSEVAEWWAVNFFFVLCVRS